MAPPAEWQYNLPARSDVMHCSGCASILTRAMKLKMEAI